MLYPAETAATTITIYAEITINADRIVVVYQYSERGPRLLLCWIYAYAKVLGSWQRRQLTKKYITIILTVYAAQQKLHQP